MRAAVQGAFMKTWKLNTYLMIGLQALVLLGGLVAAANMSAADDSKQKAAPPSGPLIRSLQGPDLYRAYCASCHGADAKGNGPVTPALNTTVPDLTTIAQRNGGVFPTLRMRKIISGDEVIVAHGSREMPVWGPIFHRVEEDRDYGEVRLQRLTDYLQSLQGK
jgi:mono/diheme cytochrome c family protein